MILYSHKIYERIAPALNIFQRKNPYRENREKGNSFKTYDIILIGIGRFGNRVAEMLDSHKDLSYVGVDFDPAIVKRWDEKGKDVLYGDVDDPELLEQIPFENSKFIISTIPVLEHSQHLIKSLKQQDYQGKIFVTASNEHDRSMPEKYGVTKVLMPHQMAATNFYNEFLKNLVS